MADKIIRPDIGHTPKERHPFFGPLFDWATKVFDSSIATELEILLNKLSTLWSRANRDHHDGKSVDRDVHEFTVCIEGVEGLLERCPRGTEDFQHLNNIKIALRDALLPQLQNMQKLV